MPTNNPGCLSTQLIVGGNQRHLHFLPLTRMAILQYLVKVLLRCIKVSTAMKFDVFPFNMGLALGSRKPKHMRNQLSCAF